MVSSVKNSNYVLYTERFKVLKVCATSFATVQRDRKPMSTANYAKIINFIQV